MMMDLKYQSTADEKSDSCKKICITGTLSVPILKNSWN